MRHRNSPRFPFKTHARIRASGHRAAEGSVRVDDGRRSGEVYLGTHSFTLLAILIEAAQRKAPGDRGGLGAFVTAEVLSQELVRRTRHSQHPVDPVRLNLNRLIHRLRKALGAAVRPARRAVEWGKNLIEYVPGLGYRISTRPDEGLSLEYVPVVGPSHGGGAAAQPEIESDEEIVVAHEPSGKPKIHRFELQRIER